MDPVSQPIQPLGIEDNRPQSKFLYSLLRNRLESWQKLLHRVNRLLPKDGTEEMTGPLELATYTVATLPTASEYTGSVICVSDGGPSFSGAQVKKSSNQAIVNATNTPLVWHTEEYDYGDWFASSGDNFFTVPTGVSKIIISVGAYWAAGTGAFRTLTIYKNGATFDGNPEQIHTSTPVGFPDSYAATSGVIECVATDTFVARVVHSHGSNLNVNADTRTYFSINAVGFIEGYGGTFQGSNGTRWVPIG